MNFHLPFPQAKPPLFALSALRDGRKARIVSVCSDIALNIRILRHVFEEAFGDVHIAKRIGLLE